MPGRRLILALSIGLAACGFQLRSDWDLPYESIYVDVPAHSEFGAQLKRMIAGTGAAKVAESREAAQAILVPTGDFRERKILSYSSSGRAREIQLRYRYSFRVLGVDGKDLIMPAVVDMTRDMTYDESQTLAKAQEEELLWSDMLNDLSHQVMRRLGGKKPAQAPAGQPRPAVPAATPGAPAMGR